MKSTSGDVVRSFDLKMLKNTYIRELNAGQYNNMTFSSIIKSLMKEESKNIHNNCSRQISNRTHNTEQESKLHKQTNYPANDFRNIVILSVLFFWRWR